MQERKKDLNEHRDDSMFSFDPASVNVKILAKNHQKKIDARKGVLLASYTRKKTRRRKRGRSNALVGGLPEGGNGQTPPVPSVTHQKTRCDLQRCYISYKSYYIHIAGCKAYFIILK